MDIHRLRVVIFAELLQKYKVLVLFLYRMMISPLHDLTFYKVYLLAVELQGFYQ